MATTEKNTKNAQKKRKPNPAKRTRKALKHTVESERTGFSALRCIDILGVRRTELGFPQKITNKKADMINWTTSEHNTVYATDDSPKMKLRKRKHFCSLISDLRHCIDIKLVPKYVPGQMRNVLKCALVRCVKGHSPRVQLDQARTAVCACAFGASGHVWLCKL